MIGQLCSSHLKSPEKMVFDGKDLDETILYVIRRGFITNIPWIASTIVLVFAPSVVIPFFSSLNTAALTIVSIKFGVVLTLFIYLFTFGFFFQNFINWFFNVYIITDKRILDVDFKGFLYKNISETPLSKIEDVTSKVSGALAVIFNYGDVLIQTAAEQHEFEFEKVDCPEKVRDIISDLIAKKEAP